LKNSKTIIIYTLEWVGKPKYHDGCKPGSRVAQALQAAIPQKASRHDEN
jgi:hypothetical protein